MKASQTPLIPAETQVSNRNRSCVQGINLGMSFPFTQAQRRTMLDCRGACVQRDLYRWGLWQSWRTAESSIALDQSPWLFLLRPKRLPPCCFTPHQNPTLLANPCCVHGARSAAGGADLVLLIAFRPEEERGIGSHDDGH